MLKLMDKKNEQFHAGKVFLSGPRNVEDILILFWIMLVECSMVREVLTPCLPVANFDVCC